MTDAIRYAIEVLEWAQEGANGDMAESCGHAIEALKAEQPAPAARVPDGYVLVPAEVIDWIYGASASRPSVAVEMLEKIVGTLDKAAPQPPEQPSARVPDWKDPYTNNGDLRKDVQYRNGWNDCRDAMQSVAPQPPEQEPHE